MHNYVAHLAADNGYETACGEPWQGWQAPDTDIYHRHIYVTKIVELPPHDEPPKKDVIRQCQACLRVAMKNAS